jgi:hypothetical protein
LHTLNCIEGEGPVIQEATLIRKLPEHLEQASRSQMHVVYHDAALPSSCWSKRQRRLPV